MAKIIKLNKNKISPLFQSWSYEETKEYEGIRKKELNSVYIIKELPLKFPALRIKYLDKLLGKLGYNLKTDSVNVLAKEEGKAKALVFLEEIVLTEFNSAQSFNRGNLLYK